MSGRPFLIFVFLLSLLPSHVDARMLVKLSPQGGSAAFLSIQSGKPGWKYLQGVDLYLVEDEGRGLLNSLKETGVVQKEEPEATIQIEALPNDPLVDAQGWIQESATLDLGIAEAWDLATGSPEVTVAVIDTGIDLHHQDLEDNLWVNPGEIPGNGIDDDKNGFVDDVYGFNFRDENGDVKDQNNHGSHMSGVIGAVGDNGVGVAGVNWRVKLMTLKFTDAQGNGTSTAAVEAIDYAIRNGANVINGSWILKAANPEGQEDSLLRQAIEKAGEAGILFVSAAGNQFETGVGLDIDTTPVYPAKFGLDNLMTVSALDEKGGLAAYSNYGARQVDLAAPGSSVLSTLADGGYGVMSGTSIATAFVSGAAALLLSVDPELTPQEIKSLLIHSVNSSDSLKNFVSSGGSLNLRNALSTLTGHPLSSTSSGTKETPPPAEPTTPPSSPASGGCSLIPDLS